MKNKSTVLLVLVAILLSSTIVSAMAARSDDVNIVVSPEAALRVHYGVSKLQSALETAGYKVNIETGNNIGKVSIAITTGDVDKRPASLPSSGKLDPTAESFVIISKPKTPVLIAGADDAGLMYGCLELAKVVEESGRLPKELEVSQTPRMSLRGTCILLEKLGKYDYPITPKEFPFFYDKEMWIDYLDFLAENKFNYIAFWNGHPFAYFVQMDKYPEAQKGLDPAILRKNRKMLMWLGNEADKRNIWLMFQFYNIHTSVYMPENRKMPANWRSIPSPLMRDYTSYCIEQFVSEFPRIGLYVCLGESLNSDYAVDWMNNVILAAVKKTGKNPPIMLRQWSIDLKKLKQIVGNYEPLYTELKYNIESVVGTKIDKRNVDWANVSGNHVVNIHIMANLEPFRWSPPSYIQQCMQSSVEAGGTGLHLYSRKCWRWPYGSDKVDTPQPQWHRDWMWYETWARYAWNPYEEPEQERQYWLGRLEKHFGNKAAAKYMLESFETGADVLPGIQWLIWLRGGGHHPLALGVGMEQIINLQKYQEVHTPLWLKPSVMRIIPYIKAIRTGQKVDAQSPTEYLAERVKQAQASLDKAKHAAAAATANKEEASRIVSDSEAVLYVADFYYHKTKAAIAKVRYDEGIEPKENARQCLESLKASVEIYRKLNDLTKTTYESISDCPAYDYVGKIPCPFHWSDAMGFLEEELVQYKKKLKTDTQ